MSPLLTLGILEKSELPTYANCIDDVPKVHYTQKLRDPRTTKAVRDQENSLLECIEMVHRFSQPGDTVMDAYAGTMTTAMACLRLGRKVVVVEGDKNCWDLALSRLKSYFAFICNRVDAGKMVIPDKDNPEPKFSKYEMSVTTLLREMGKKLTFCSYTNCHGVSTRNRPKLIECPNKVLYFTTHLHSLLACTTHP